jgi:trk system potassium uptake protein
MFHLLKKAANKVTSSLNQTNRGNKKGRLSVPARIISGLILLIFVGTSLLVLPGVTIRPLTTSEALFTATSALTVTGLTVVPTGATFTIPGQIILLILIQIGGVGYTFVASVALRLIGRQLTYTDRLTLTTSLGLETPGAITKVLRRSLYGLILMEGVGALLLYIHWRSNGIVEGNLALHYALFHAVSAFCNAGFDLFTGLPQYPEGIPRDHFTLIVMGILIIMGGLGIPVLSELITRRPRKWFSLHTRLTLWAVVILVLAGWVGLLLPEVRAGGVMYDLPLDQQLTRAWFQSISARTAGFSAFANFEELTAASQLLLMGLMFIGSAPASMGGGITTGAFAVLGLAVWSYARGLPRVSFGGRTIALGTVRRASAVLVVGLGVVLLSSWLIMATHDFTFNRVLFEVVSAFATAGLSLGITPDLNLFGRLIIIFMMVWGRLGALTIVIAIAHRGTQQNQLIAYPEESVLM